jgi:hypothetical protein
MLKNPERQDFIRTMPDQQTVPGESELLLSMVLHSQYPETAALHEDRGIFGLQMRLMQLGLHFGLESTSS